MIKLEPLTGSHDRLGFDCGVEVLNSWLQRTALQHQGRGISRSFVAVLHDGEAVSTCLKLGYKSIGLNSILGFYALAFAQAIVEDIPPGVGKRFPRQIPVTRLGRLAIRSDLKGQGLGALLLADAISRARNVAQAVGSTGIVVDAKDEVASSFYQRYGFVVCQQEPIKLFLPMW
ncbi:MAG: GNAT family N-acetyltransferase [Rhodoferax sp.]|nr:GNAT family N-acetyltransferase [Rhodoferax sp.]